MLLLIYGIVFTNWLPTDGRTDGPTDRRMDGLTDGRTDGQTQPLIEMRRTHLKSIVEDDLGLIYAIIMFRVPNHDQFTLKKAEGKKQLLRLTLLSIDIILLVITLERMELEGSTRSHFEAISIFYRMVTRTGRRSDLIINLSSQMSLTKKF